MNQSIIQKKKFLLVDDEPDFREFVKSTLELAFEDKVSILEAQDGLVGSKLLTNQRFDCIISDLQMPRRDGKEFINHIRMSELNRETPVIVITSNPDTKIDQKKVAVLPKPLNAKLLIAALMKLLGLGSEKSEEEGEKFSKYFLLLLNEFVSVSFGGFLSFEEESNSDGIAFEEEFYILFENLVNDKENKVLLGVGENLAYCLAPKLGHEIDDEPLKMVESFRKQLVLHFVNAKAQPNFKFEMQGTEILLQNDKKFDVESANCAVKIQTNCTLGDLSIYY